MNLSTSAPATQLHDRLSALRKAASQVILGKERELDLALACLISGGHLLIEDIPGVGKTTLVKTLAKLLNLSSSRIQFTNDLLPADIIGNSIYDVDRKQFVFHRGPLFAQLVLADELNRATPKTQSACLQAMEERQVSVDGVTHELPTPFFVIATQNPRQQIGTFPLPESQLDRFTMRIALGYPDREAERLLLTGSQRQDLLDSLTSVAHPDDLIAMRKAASAVHASDALIAYLQDLVSHTREHLPSGSTGLSPRGALSLLSAAKAWAFMANRRMVLPEDLQAVAVAVMSHRLNPLDDLSGSTGVRWAEDTVAAIRVD